MPTDPDGVAGVVTERDVAVRMRDDVTLRCNVYRPDDSGAHPTLLQRQPYNKHLAQTYVYAHPAWYARRGYAVVVQDTRGRYASEGEFYPLRLDAEDGYDTIEWCAAQPWSNGRIGTYGFSYPGINQLLAAAERPPHLVATMPGFYFSGMYEGFTHIGGTFGLAAVLDWALILAGDVAARTRDEVLAAQLRKLSGCGGNWHPTQSLRELPVLVEPPIMPFLRDYLDHPSHDDYWREGAIGPRVSRIAVPCLHISGWYDTFVTQTVETYERCVAETEVEHRLLVGPWYHLPWSQQVGCVDYGEDARNVVDDYQLAWCDAWLKGERAALDALPAVRVFVTGENRWRDAERWPLPGQNESWYLHSEGRANSLSGNGRLGRETPSEEEPDFFVYDPYQPVPSVGGHSCCYPGNAPMGPQDQRPVEVRNDVLVYTSDPLGASLLVAGRANVILFAASSAVDTDFTVKLCDVAPDGTSLNMQEGVIRARFRESREREVLIEPGRIYEYRIDLGGLCHSFGTGHRIRVQVTSSDYPAYDRNPNTGVPIGAEAPFSAMPADQTVFHDAGRASRLELPVATG